jgi:PAS domain S-box-containing protein
MTSSDRTPPISPDDAAAETLQQIARERDRAHRALEEREAELARIQRIGRVGGVEVDLQNGIRNRRSPEYLMIHGLGPEAVNETHDDWVKRIHPADRERTVAHFLAALAGRDEDYLSEYRIIRPSDGQVRWISVTAKIDRDGDGRAIRLVGAHIDVTDRMVAQDTLRESEERFRLIANSAPVPIWVTKLDRTRSFANQAYLDFLGLSFEEAIVFDWRKALYPDDLPRILKEQVEGESSLKPFVLEARYKRADGEWRWLRSESQPRWNAEGDHVGFIGVAHDITAAKQAEIELRQINETLERRIEERTAQLRKGEEALRQSQKMEAIGQLTGGVAHDFNNLLTIIRSATDFLRRRDLPEERRSRYIDAISETVERASKLTAQLLAFARRQPLKPQVFNVGIQVENIVQLIRPLVGDRIRIGVEIDSPNYFAVADIAQFETALINLAVNGRDAMEDEGHLKILVKRVTSIPELRGTPSRNGEFIAVSVNDTGTGIPAEKLEAIFEPFFTTKEVGRGTGLGLSQAFGFAKQSEGDIEVISTVGKGSTFIIYLPQAAIPVEAPAAAAIGGDTVTSGRGYRVLVVEDNEDVGQFSTELLKDLGYIIQWVRSADEALAVLTEDEFAVDLVFSDVIMPGMNGVELAGVIRQRYPGLPVVLTSGYSNILAENADLGFELIQKPYSVESLSRIVRKAISGKRFLAQ